mmetsp:Transcript_63303/g.150027  ORF Transcript_63303/g.150027 Transcript_63303/m.150027 type:complete len:176 (+) Transcript_63303:42-569(+)
MTAGYVTPGTNVVVVHCAADHRSDTIHTLDTTDMDASFRLQISEPLSLISSLLAHMSPSSSIILVGSTLSEKAVAGRLSYVTAKHAMVGAMRSLTQDLFGSGIHCACVCPGFTDTPMLNEALDAAPTGTRERVLDMVSNHRLLAPEELAELIHSVALTPAYNGAVLHANLGQRES